MPKRPKGVESIPAPWWGTVASHLQAEGVGRNEAMKAIPDGQGPKALAQWIQGRLGAKTTAKADKTDKGGRTVIKSWDEFLRSWQNCRTQQEAIGLVLACGESSEGWSSASPALTIPSKRNENTDTHNERERQEMTERFMFLRGIETNDPDLQVRRAANHVLWENFILRYETSQRGFIWDCTPEIFSEACEFVSEELTRGYWHAVEGTAQFLCIIAHAIHMKEFSSEHKFLEASTQSLKELVELAYRLEREAKRPPGEVMVGHNWGNQGRDALHTLALRKLLEWEVSGGPYVLQPVLPIDMKVLAPSLRAFFVEELQKSFAFVSTE